MTRTGKASTPEKEAERRRKISEARMGMKFSDEHRANIGAAHKGLKPSDEARAKMSAAQSGRSITWGDKISEAKTGIPVPALRGPRPGAQVAAPRYRAAHARIHTARGPAAGHVCLDCGQPALHWSFAWRRVDRDKWLWDGRPYTGEPLDYDPRCGVCARRYDTGGYGLKDKMVRPPVGASSMLAK